MKLKINLALVFLCFGILNVLFLLDTILTESETEFSLFLLSTNKIFNLSYYGITIIILFLASYYMLNKKKIEKCHN